MAEESIEIEERYLLVVEGPDDYRVFRQLIQYLGFSEIQIIELKGSGNFRGRLNAIKQAPNFDTVEKIGLVLDSDGNPVGRFQSIRDSLRNIGLPAPDQSLMWTESSEEFPSIGVMILPPREDMGHNMMLEDVLLNSIEGSETLDCVEQYFECLEGMSLKFADSKISKAKIYAFLAAQADRPGRRIGEAAEKGIWNFEHQAFSEIKTFINQLASDE